MRSPVFYTEGNVRAKTENRKNMACLPKDTAFVSALPKSILYCCLTYRTLTTPLQ